MRKQSSTTPRVLATATGLVKFPLTKMGKTLGKERIERRNQAFGFRHKFEMLITWPSGRVGCVENASLGFRGGDGTEDVAVRREKKKKTLKH